MSPDREIHLELGDKGQAWPTSSVASPSWGSPPGSTSQGTFREGTRAAVEAFQYRRGLRVDGVCGRQTWSALVEAGRRLGDRFLYRRSPMLRGRRRRRTPAAAERARVRHRTGGRHLRRPDLRGPGRVPAQRRAPRRRHRRRGHGRRSSCGSDPATTGRSWSPPCATASGSARPPARWPGVASPSARREGSGPPWAPCAGSWSARAPWSPPTTTRTGPSRPQRPTPPRPRCTSGSGLASGPGLLGVLLRRIPLLVAGRTSAGRTPARGPVEHARTTRQRQPRHVPAAAARDADARGDLRDRPGVASWSSGRAVIARAVVDSLAEWVDTAWD